VDLWAQYYLDNAATVPEAIKLAKKITVAPYQYDGVVSPVQLLLRDAKGRVAIMEYLKGKLHIYTGKSVPVNVLSNSTYPAVVKLMSRYKPFGGKKALLGNDKSQSRFLREAAFFKNMPAPKNEQAAVSREFEALAYVAEPPGAGQCNSQGDPTQWTVVRDLKHRMMYYRTARNQYIEKIDLNNVDFSKLDKQQVLGYM
jgi:choloylglycine hydrolase